MLDYNGIEGTCTKIFYSRGEEGDAPPKSMSKSMVAFKKTWGIEWVSKIFDAYSHLQVNSDVSFAA